MDYADVPAFIADLREREAMAALALEFLILTAARSAEVYGARWQGRAHDPQGNHDFPALPSA